MSAIFRKIQHSFEPLLTCYRTHRAEIDHSHSTGRKTINQYEILGEIGRGVHGKVKLARNLENGDKVAIKIIQRYSRKRRLGKISTVSPEDKTKREIAILKKIRHPNVVGLYEVIDDPEFQKIYMVLEFVELGEVKWRMKGTPGICAFERRRIEREIRGEPDRGEDERIFRLMERRRIRKDAQRAKMAQQPQGDGGFWSLEHGDDDEDYDGDVTPLSRVSSQESLFIPRSFQSHTSHMSHTSFVRSNPPSRSNSRTADRPDSARRRRAPTGADVDLGGIASDSGSEDLETPGPLPSLPSTHSSGTGFHAHGLAHINRHHASNEAMGHAARGRTPSVSDSIVSNMSSIDDGVIHDQFEDDFSYVPCFTLDQARSTFRDTVLGLEYLHYEGIVHRDIKPANLLWTKEHRVKISDFGVSYFGRPVRDGEPEDVSESDAYDFDDDLELSKTVGTPAFFAPELCYTDTEVQPPKVTEQIDVWSLGVTLYCLIFARIPFMADDEYQLFRAIAQDDVHIPKRRLKAVDPGDKYTDARIPASAQRQEHTLVMEPVDDELHDLLKRMLIKNPAERMKLREVKRHPWVIRGIDNVIGWLDDTDPSRKTAGRRIQVEDKELERAVIPISFVERARSAIKKTVNKVLGSGSRKRAPSTATSSGDGGWSTPQTPMYDRDARRQSARMDDSYFAPISDHPLTQSVTASPVQEPLYVGDMDVASRPLTIPSNRVEEPPSTHRKAHMPRPLGPNRSISTAATIKAHLPSVHRSALPSPQAEAPCGKYSPDLMHTFTDFGGAIRDTIRLKNIRSMDLMKKDQADAVDRAKSADRAGHGHGHKHSESTTSVTKAIAGSVQSLFGHHHSRNTNDTQHVTERMDKMAIAHPAPHRPALTPNHKPSLSSPIIGTLNYAAMKLDNRPSTATRAPTEVRTPPRLWTPTTPESLAREQEQLEAQGRLQQIGISRQHTPSNALEKSYPPSPLASPRDAAFGQHRYDQPRHGSQTQLEGERKGVPNNADESNLTSPISSATLNSDHDQSQRTDRFPSHPSLPALVSSSTSVSGDQESDVATQDSVLTLRPTAGRDGSPDTLKAVTSNPYEKYVPGEKEPEILDESRAEEKMRDEMYAARADWDVEPPNHYAREEESDSDSDGGLMMGRNKKKPMTPVKAKSTPVSKSSSRERASFSGTKEESPVIMRGSGMRLERRNTNASIGSTGTAKRLDIE